MQINNFEDFGKFIAKLRITKENWPHFIAGLALIAAGFISPYIPQPKDAEYLLRDMLWISGAILTAVNFIVIIERAIRERSEK